VYNAKLMAETRETAAQLQKALVSRTVIDQAIGIVRARSGSTAEEAFGRLRQISQTENTKLHEVARRVVDDAVRRARARHAEPPGPGT
jgi:AmiR/NasT family two-component response regulator